MKNYRFVGRIYTKYDIDELKELIKKNPNTLFAYDEYYALLSDEYGQDYDFEYISKISSLEEGFKPFRMEKSIYNFPFIREVEEVKE